MSGPFFTSLNDCNPSLDCNSISLNTCNSPLGSGKASINSNNASLFYRNLRTISLSSWEQNWNAYRHGYWQ
jgi:hypothetical protein